MSVLGACFSWLIMFLADGATGIDLTTALIEPIKTGIMGNIEAALPVVASVAAVMLGIGIVLKLVKKAVKG